MLKKNTFGIILGFLIGGFGVFGYFEFFEKEEGVQHVLEVDEGELAEFFEEMTGEEKRDYSRSPYCFVVWGEDRNTLAAVLDSSDVEYHAFNRNMPKLFENEEFFLAIHFLKN